MVSFSTSDASCETSKIDHQTKSWKENIANQSSNSKKCNHCPCTTEQRNQFSVEGRISLVSIPTKILKHHVLIDRTSMLLLLKFPLLLLVQMTTITVITETPIDQIVIDISSPQGQHTNNKGTHMITGSKLKNDPSLKSQMVTFATTRSDISEPKHIEIKTLIQNRTWDLVPRPLITNIVGSKWVFKTNLKEDGTIDRYKARLVARGFLKYRFLWRDLHPVIKHTIIKLILSLAVNLGWKMRQLDVKNAFLHRFLKEEVFMEQPPDL
ncbi:hypothetical protein AAG906_002191 [Vitis piasezkii]